MAQNTGFISLWPCATWTGGAQQNRAIRGDMGPITKVSETTFCETPLENEYKVGCFESKQNRCGSQGCGKKWCLEVREGENQTQSRKWFNLTSYVAPSSRFAFRNVGLFVFRLEVLIFGFPELWTLGNHSCFLQDRYANKINGKQPQKNVVISDSDTLPHCIHIYQSHT